MMQSLRIPSLALLLGAAACGSSVTAEEYDDVANSMSGLLSGDSAGEAEAVDDAATVANGQLPPAMTRQGQGVLTGRRGTIDYSFEVTCNDAGGAVLANCEGADSAHLLLEWTGELATARRTANLERHGDWTMTQLQSAEAVLNGSGSFHLEGDFAALYRAETRSYVLDYQAEYQDVRITKATRQIAGGVATYSISADRTTSRALGTKERHFDVVAEVTFLGDGKATVTLDGSRTYQVDTRSGAVTLSAE